MAKLKALVLHLKDELPPEIRRLRSKSRTPKSCHKRGSPSKGSGSKTKTPTPRKPKSSSGSIKKNLKAEDLAHQTTLILGECYLIRNYGFMIYCNAQDF